MEIIDIIKALADSSLGLLIAIIVIYWNRKDSKDHIERARAQTAQEREDKILLINTLQENSKILAELKTLVQRLNGKN